MNTLKIILRAWALGLVSVFGVLIGGFVLWSIGKAVIEPRTAALAGCVTGESCQFTLVNGSGGVRVVGYSADGRRLITRGGSTLVHDAEDGSRVARINPDFSPFQPRFMGAMPQIAAVGRGTIAFYDYDGNLLSTWTTTAEERITGFAGLADLNGFALASENNITLYSLNDGQVFGRLPNSQGMRHLAVSSNGMILASFNTETESIHVWPLDNLSDSIVIPDVGQMSPATQSYLQMSRDGSLVAALSNNMARVWRTADGSLVESIDHPDFTLTNIALASDGSHLAVAYTDGFAEVWSLATGDRVQQFEHRRNVSGLAFSPDASRLAVGLSREGRTMQITASQRDTAWRRYRQGERFNTSDRFLSPHTTYTSTRPGYAIVWAVGD